VRWGPLLAVVSVAVVAVAAAVTVAVLRGRDDGAPAVPAVLLDGSAPRSVPFELDEEAVAGLVRVRREATAGYVQSCAAVFGLPPLDPGAEAALRIGVDTRTVTYRAADGRLYGCDAAARADEPRARWCASAAGFLRGGRLADARLTLANCGDADDRRLALAWYEPVAGARWVGVRRDGYVELYAVSGDLPVRIATTEAIDQARSAAAFEVVELDAAGDELRNGTWRTRVAG
jgi:hypothetical protein